MVNFNKISKKWQKRWEDAGIFHTKVDPKKNKLYVLEMYPYPSGSGLHMGHARNYCIGDAFARFKRMRGFNVLYPMGYDSFGLPAENAAIKAKSHPKIFTEKAIKNFQKQQKALGLSYDWNRMIMSHDPAYYRWDQWIFLKMYEKGLAYKRKATVNWCPKCNTVLANEQVHNGKCWRHTDTQVEFKELNQWFLKITAYADELLDDIPNLNWNEDVKTMQKNWIGKSKGTLIHFPVVDKEKTLTVFTTRPDTFFGITFLVYAPEHPDVLQLVEGTEYEQKVRAFISKVMAQDRFDRTAEDKEKEGMFIGQYAINPVTKEKIPIYIANFVLYEYGTGAIIAVPAHDQRDFEFAKKYNLPIKVVINPPDYDLNADKMARAYIGSGNMVNSAQFDGMNNIDAINEITKFLQEKGYGKFTTQYRLRDWLISRQRFWGCPIPIVYCDKCGTVAVNENELPVRLPDDVKFTSAKNPLIEHENFVNTDCPKCGGNAKRETDTMDTFIDSSWYYLRYCDPNNNRQAFNPEKAAYWMPIDMYIGGKEHATMHLIYFRFFTKFLRDIGMVKIDEPALNLFNQGMLHKNGVVMSKSKGNVVTQEEISEKYGIDTARFFLLFVAAPDKDMEWDDKGIEGAYRFLKKLYYLVDTKDRVKKEIKIQETKIHKTVKDVTEYINNFNYNKALIRIMETVNYIHNEEKISQDIIEKLILILSPFTPHICEELWERIGRNGFVSNHEWPEYDEEKIDTTLEAQEGIIDQTLADIRSVIELADIEPKNITLIMASAWKYDVFRKIKDKLEKTRNISEIIKDVKDGKHDKEIAQFVQKAIKNPAKLPEYILSPEEEIDALSRAKDKISSIFKCDVEVKVAEESESPKAKSAAPYKPAIVVS